MVEGGECSSLDLMRAFLDHYQQYTAKDLHLCGKKIIIHITKLAQKNPTLKRQKGELLQVKLWQSFYVVQKSK